MENLPRYIIRASFSQERMTYLEQSTVVYRAKNGTAEKAFDALEWLANLCSHVPNKGEQMVRYYGFYSNVSRGKRQMNLEDDFIPCILEPDGDSKACRKNWARLIQKIYEIDPLVCLRCQGQMRIISSIEDADVIKTILKHLGLWLIKARPIHKAHAPPPVVHVIDDYSQLPMNDDHLYRDPDYPCDAYIQS